MKRFQFSIRDLLLIIVIAALAAGWWIDHQRINHIAVQKWQYMTFVPNFSKTDSELNSFAVQGWEICGVAGDGSNMRYVFRRPAQ